ncbi:MAG: superoxide dismutase [Patescibacteria group bacterium]
MNKKIHTLPDLPYAYDALEPYIDEETMKLHHGKHHLAYVNNLNSAIEKYPELQEKSAEELIKDLQSVSEEIRTAVRNNAGGHVNHTMFWQIMGPNAGGEPTGPLAEEINKAFDSFAQFREKFNDAGLKRFGSGWVWLVQNQSGTLEIISTPNQDNPITEGHNPIMGNDVWEHAYYLKYKNMRADYLKAWWNAVNWQEVEKRFTI